VFILAPFIPARYILRSVSVERLAGPIVQTILVFFKNSSPILSSKDIADLCFNASVYLFAVHVRSFAALSQLSKSHLYCRRKSEKRSE